ncbi:MAG: T9SS type A sorting domain-containing protein [Saprospiraceae bacterium]|nr:T9SS type A sorting domain-containing protein [Saprospiraceae bacterium]
MKKCLPILALLAFTAALSAQITVTSATFPVAGDTLWFNFDNSPGTIGSLTAPGPQDWDFTGLTADATQATIYHPASGGTVGAQLPEATLYTNPGPFSEEYFKVTATEVGKYAYYGLDPFGIGINTIIHFTPPLTERKAPMNFFDINQSTSGSLEGWPTSTLPTLFVTPLPFNSDSMRIRMVINRIEAVDAYGSMSIPGGTYDVLRVKRTQYQESRIDAKVPPLGWLDVTDQVLQHVPGTNFGVDTTYSYLFYNDVGKEPIAIVTLDNDAAFATQIMYKNTTPPVVNGLAEVNATNPSVKISPNPASHDVVLVLNNLISGSYRLSIFDGDGRVVFEKNAQLNGQHTERVDLSQQVSGVYFFSLFDENGRAVCQGKLAKK